MNIRALLPLAVLSSALLLSACGNKGPLLPPPAPDEDDWEQVDDSDDADGYDDEDDAGGDGGA